MAKCWRRPFLCRSYLGTEGQTHSTDENAANKEKKDAFLRICPSERWACCCFVCLAEPDPAQPSDKQKQDL